MNPLIERYIYDVVRRLPTKQRTQVEKELLAQIMGMLGENPTDEDVTRVLDSLGSPVSKAEQYRSDKRYLISPAVYDDYWAVLKIVAIVLFMATLISSIVKYIVEGPSTIAVSDLINAIILTILGCAVTAAMVAFVSVTVVFVCIDRFGNKNKERAWSVRDLPRMPHRARRISRNATLISMIFMVIFNAVLVLVMLRYSRYLALYTDFTPSVPLFHADILIGLVPYVIALAIGALLVSVMKLYYGHWNFPLAFFNALYRVASTAFVIYFVNYANVFNQDFVTRMGEMLIWDPNTTAMGFQKGLLILTGIIIVASVWDIVKCFYLAYRSDAR